MLLFLLQVEEERREEGRKEGKRQSCVSAALCKVDDRIADTKLSRTRLLSCIPFRFYFFPLLLWSSSSTRLSLSSPSPWLPVPVSLLNTLHCSHCKRNPTHPPPLSLSLRLSYDEFITLIRQEEVGERIKGKAKKSYFERNLS